MFENMKYCGHNASKTKKARNNLYFLYKKWYYLLSLLHEVEYNDTKMFFLAIGIK